MLCEVESGNVVLLLSLITGAEESLIEEMIINGIQPGEVANKFGKYDEYKQFLKNNVLSQLQTLIDNEEITVKEANDLFNRIGKS